MIRPNYSTQNQSAQTTAKALYENFVVHYGLPARIQGDLRANFESKLIWGLCRLTGLKKPCTILYHPLGLKRTLQNMLELLKKVLNKLEVSCLDHTPCT